MGQFLNGMHVACAYFFKQKMAVESKHFKQCGRDGVFEGHEVSEGTYKRFTFPNIDAPIGVVTAFCPEGKGVTHLSETPEASLVFFDGKEGHENGVNLGSNVAKEFSEGESVAIIDKDGNHTWLFTYSIEQGVTGEPLKPFVQSQQLEPEIPNRQTTHRDRMLAKQELVLTSR